MGFSEHLTWFGGKQVIEYQLGVGLSPEAAVYRLRVEYDAHETATDHLMALLEDPLVDRLTGLLLGSWSAQIRENHPPSVFVQTLVAAAGQLPCLNALFIGDIISEECEISWIHQTNVSHLWSAFPKLKELRIRGSLDLSLGNVTHDQLERLVIECGGLPQNVLQELAAAKLPALEHLELYLGVDDYGWDGTVQDLEPLLTGKLFPKLQFLGLRDSGHADEVAAIVTKSPLLDRIQVLDMSLGTMTDLGANALLRCSAITNLKRLDLHHHFISPAIAKKLQSLPIAVDVSDPREADDSGGEAYRYVAVAE